ncbi:hypothetical protein SteCoe_23802 [Stentor coeruleus]|uniref:Uncharacterized protein n=1 Tax=Stentor coeruleus TaxID=5963 RepID=A0A1R2BJ23_9CILI|nr:hypothetical protein SteCoe_23802 [Stentor coeruleus]
MEMTELSTLVSPPSTQKKHSFSNDTRFFHHKTSYSYAIQMNSEKLKLNFERYQLNNEATSIQNRINKLLNTEKTAVKEMLQVKSIAKDTHMKKERNLKKLQEKEMRMKEKLDEKERLRERVQLQRFKRADKIKNKEKAIVLEKQEIVKKVKEAEKNWEIVRDTNRYRNFEEKQRHRMSMKQELDLQFKERCVSQMVNRNKIKSEFEKQINNIRAEQEIMKKGLEVLKSKQDLVFSQVSNVLQKKEKVFKDYGQYVPFCNQ